MHIKAKKMAFGGLLLALSVICMILGSVIETGTLFLLAAASFFVGIVFREFGRRTAAAFYVAGVLLGLILAPNKLYVATYGAMGFFILAEETAWDRLGGLNAGVRKKTALLWGIRYGIFNLLYLPAVLFFRSCCLRERCPSGWSWGFLPPARRCCSCMWVLMDMYRGSCGESCGDIFSVHEEL